MTRLVKREDPKKWQRCSHADERNLLANSRYVRRRSQAEETSSDSVHLESPVAILNNRRRGVLIESYITFYEVFVRININTGFCAQLRRRERFFHLFCG